MRDIQLKYYSSAHSRESGEFLCLGTDPTIKPVLDALFQCHDLTDAECRDAIGSIMDGNCDAVDIASFLTAMAAKGPVSAELVGAAMAMRSRATLITSCRRPLLDTCGTGGDKLHTFNISTASALVAASCGIAVAKHGNRSVSSSSGSADVLECWASTSR